MMWFLLIFVKLAHSLAEIDLWGKEKEKLFNLFKSITIDGRNFIGLLKGMKKQQWNFFIKTVFIFCSALYTQFLYRCFDFLALFVAQSFKFLIAIFVQSYETFFNLKISFKVWKNFCTFNRFYGFLQHFPSNDFLIYSISKKKTSRPNIKQITS